MGSVLSCSMWAADLEDIQQLVAAGLRQDDAARGVAVRVSVRRCWRRTTGDRPPEPHLQHAGGMSLSRQQVYAPCHVDVLRIDRNGGRCCLQRR